MGFVTEEKKDVFQILRRIKKKDFSGNTGQAIKNSIYQLSTSIIFKIGSLFFTIIIARILLPDLFGLYTLALSTILLFAAFSDLGISSALVTFVSKSLGKNENDKAKSYIKKLFFWKASLLLLSSFLLLSLSYFITDYYNKAIFFALLAGGIYLPVMGLVGFLELIFKANNNFSKPLVKEIIFQILRFTIVPLSVLLFLKLKVSAPFLISLIFLTLSLLYLIVGLYLIISLRNFSFLEYSSKKLTKEEIVSLKKFTLPLTATALSGLFFGSIDMVMLGHFVPSKFIAYYGASFTLIASVSTIISFASTSFFPLFPRLEASALEKLFIRGRNLTISLSIIAGFITYLLSYYLIYFVYGQEYLPSTNILKLFSILIIVLPLSGIYATYYTSKEKTKTLMFLLIFSTILNIVLNLFGITYGIKNYSALGGIYGACIATILSRLFYLVGLIKFRKNDS